MIFLFEDFNSGRPFFVGISDDGVVSMALPDFRYAFLRLSQIKKYIPRRKAKTIDAMINKFSNLDGEDLKKSVIEEASLAGRFVREVSVDEYKSFMAKR